MTSKRIGRSDVVIIGAGLSGLYAALSFGDRPVTVLSPCALGDGTSSASAQGGISASVGETDSAASHAADTISAGDGIVDHMIAQMVTQAAPDNIARLVEMGTPFEKTPDGSFALSLEAAHSVARVVRVKGDQAGAEIMRALVRKVRETSTITVLEGYTALELAKNKDRVNGLVARTPDGSLAELSAKAVLLAAGGIGGIFETTTNPSNVRGHAMGMAARAGAVIADAEFVQFHPTAIDVGLDPSPLATEALRGAGSILVNRHGERFMLDVHPKAELAPRDVVARAVFAQHQAGNRPALDTRAAVGERIKTDFPAVSEACVSAGIDPVTDLIPVVPAAHSHMGGVSTDSEGRSSLAGLWVAGEAASTGLHGANRLASNGLLEALVFGAETARSIIRNLDTLSFDNTASDGNVSGAEPNADAIADLRKTMSALVGVVRNAKGLEEALEVFDRLERDHHEYSTEFANILATARMVTASALRREESRGGHFRSDYPEKDPKFENRSMLLLSEVLESRTQKEVQ